MIDLSVSRDEVERVYGVALSISRLINTSAIEIIAAKFGLKPAMAEANTGIYDFSSKGKFNEVKRLCGEIGMVFAVSKYKYVINSPQGIFKEVPLDDVKNGSAIVGIASDAEAAVSAVAHYHLKTKHTKYGRSFGELMGYPKCCLDFGDYLANNQNDPNNFGFKNPAIETLKRSRDVAWQLNVFSTDSFLSHFPCNYTCGASIDYVDGVMELLSMTTAGRSQNIKSALKDKTALYWTCVDKAVFDGEFVRNDDFFRAGEVRYGNVSWSVGSDVYYQENDLAFIKKIAKIREAVKTGNRIVVTASDVGVFRDDDLIVRLGKENEFSPVIVKPTT